ncbi:MAG: hypothetical protein PS018_07545 [bacterium]|nr:hypothetical protein [bacterium]
MERLILTSSSGVELGRAGRGDTVISFCFRFEWGPLPSPDELAAYLGPRASEQGDHWSVYVPRWAPGEKSRRDVALIEFCEAYDTIELWFDPHPRDQLHLIWLLDYFRSYPQIASKLVLRLVDFYFTGTREEQLARYQVYDVKVTDAELETAGASWQAYRAPTPDACFDLLSSDLSSLPLFRPALVDLLEELPSDVTGLGGTEMRLLEMIARGYDHTNELFHFRSVRRRLLFGEYETGYLLEGLAHGAMPAVAGLDNELRALSRDNYRDRHTAFLRSRYSLTEFGKAVVAHREDFSRHNRIDRWWGGTHLTNDHLWCWKPTLVKR